MCCSTELQKRGNTTAFVLQVQVASGLGPGLTTVSSQTAGEKPSSTCFMNPDLNPVLRARSLEEHPQVDDKLESHGVRVHEISNQARGCNTTCNFLDLPVTKFNVCSFFFFFFVLGRPRIGSGERYRSRDISIAIFSVTMVMLCCDARAAAACVCGARDVSNFQTKSSTGRTPIGDIGLLVLPPQSTRKFLDASSSSICGITSPVLTRGEHGEPDGFVYRLGLRRSTVLYGFN